MVHLMPDRFRRGPMTAVHPCLHDAGAGEQAAGAGPVAAHAGRVVLEVAQGSVQLVFLVAEHELEEAGEVVQALAGVAEIDDLGGLGELDGGDVPDSGGDLVARVVARAQAVPRHEAGLAGAGVQVCARSASLQSQGPGEQQAEAVFSGDSDQDLWPSS